MTAVDSTSPGSGDPLHPVALVLGQLASLGALSSFDRQFARAMVRLGLESRPELELAAALTSRAVAHGHVCLELGAIDRVLALLDEPPTAALTRLDWPALLSTSPLVATPADRVATDPRPLVFVGPDKLYLARYFEHEQAVSHAIEQRAAVVDPVEGPHLQATIEQVFDTTDGEKPDPPRRAAAIAAQHRLLVLAGGPGTGKTTTVVRLLGVLMQTTSPPQHIALLAPTGKAVARLEAAVRRGEADLRERGLLPQPLPLSAATIHRALQPRGGPTLQFTHDARFPLAADVVVVDEASMIDMALMRRMVEAVANDAKLILLGDADQLASVEAGAVFGDICAAGRRLAPTPEAESEEPSPPSLGQCFVELTRSHRFSDTSGIGALAAAIRRGDATQALAVLDNPDDDTALLSPTTPGLPLSILEDLAAGYRLPDDQLTPTAALAHGGTFRVLAALRGGPRGVDTLNRLIERRVVAGRTSPTAGGHYEGRPILITRNDPTLGLYNGDIGVQLRFNGRLAAVFPDDRGLPRRVALARLPAHETVFAMSVHKSQGSEFDRVVVVLPDRDTALLTRELLYTAVTRARAKVTILGSRRCITDMIERTVSRASGLAERLAAARPTTRNDA